MRRWTQRFVAIAFLVSLATTVNAQVWNFGGAATSSQGTLSMAWTGSWAAGATARIDLHRGPANAAGFLFVGLSDRVSVLGPLPLDLTQFPGFAANSKLYTSSEIWIPIVTNAAGGASVSVNLPGASVNSYFLQYGVLGNGSPTTWFFSDATRVSVLPQGYSISGVVQDQVASQPASGARVTMVDVMNNNAFRETRTDSQGRFQIADVTSGTWKVGVSLLNREYVETSVIVTNSATLPTTNLVAETHQGQWQIIGNTFPETLDGTNVGVMMEDGRFWYCHSSQDPTLFDPKTGQKEHLLINTPQQGCFNSTMLLDGRILLTGGQDPASTSLPWKPIGYTKIFDPILKSYTTVQPLLLPQGRWYPGLARLADDRVLVMGGGIMPVTVYNPANPNHYTATCEIFDPNTATWTYTGSMTKTNLFPPAALLHTGELLSSYDPPQLYNPTSGQWRNTGALNQPKRGWPFNADHSLAVLADGRALVMGAQRQSTVSPPPVMGEIYNPTSGTWSLIGSNSGLPRQLPEVTPLPDGRIYVGGGLAEVSQIPVPDKRGYVKWIDIYDPSTDSWRRMKDSLYFREFHALTMLDLDARVTVTGGTVIHFGNPPVTSDVTAFYPPYHFRGPRPNATAISKRSCSRGDLLTMTVDPSAQITSVVLLGTPSHTHWVEGGVQRRLVLPVQQQAGTGVRFQLPSDTNKLPLGHYIAFAMVDDIPSNGLIFKVVR